MSFEVIETIKDNDVPKRTHKSKYDKLMRALLRLEKDECLKIKVDTLGVVGYIRKKINKEFRHNKFKVRQRSINDKYYCFISRED